MNVFQDRFLKLLQIHDVFDHLQLSESQGWDLTNVSYVLPMTLYIVCVVLFVCMFVYSFLAGSLKHFLFPQLYLRCLVDEHIYQRVVRPPDLCVQSRQKMRT